MSEELTPSEKAEIAREKLRDFYKNGEKSTPKPYWDINPKPSKGGGSGGGSGGGGGGDIPPGMTPGSKGSKGITYKVGGKVYSASKRADGCCIRGKTRA